jgi:hypothetical protein
MMVTLMKLPPAERALLLKTLSSGQEHQRRQMIADMLPREPGEPEVVIVPKPMDTLFRRETIWKRIAKKLWGDE